MGENNSTVKIYSVTVDIGSKQTAYKEPGENIWKRLMANQ